MSTHVVPKGTIAEQRDDRPAAVLRAGVLAAIALLVPRVDSRCLHRRQRAQSKRIPFLDSASSVPQSLVEVRWPVWPVGVRPTRPNPQFGIPGIRPADPVFPSRGAPMATPALGRIAPPTMPSLARRQSPAGTRWWPATPLLPLSLALGPVPPNLQMVATDPFFSRLCGHWATASHCTPGLLGERVGHD